MLALREGLGHLMIVYISIGNSDDKLGQAEWAAFAGTTQGTIRRAAMAVHGEWTSLPWSSYQNACWCVELTDKSAAWLKPELVWLAGEYHQDSIAWAEASFTEFLASGGAA